MVLNSLSFIFVNSHLFCLPKTRKKKPNNNTHTHTHAPPTSKHKCMPVLSSSLKDIKFSTNFEMQDKKKLPNEYQYIFCKKNRKVLFFFIVIDWVFLEPYTVYVVLKLYIADSYKVRFPSVFILLCICNSYNIYMCSSLFVLESKRKIHHNFLSSKRHAYSWMHMWGGVNNFTMYHHIDKLGDRPHYILIAYAIIWYQMSLLLFPSISLFCFLTAYNHFLLYTGQESSLKSQVQISKL